MYIQGVENPLEDKRREEARYLKEERRQSVMAIVICVICLAAALLVFLLILDCGRTKYLKKKVRMKSVSHFHSQSVLKSVQLAI